MRAILIVLFLFQFIIQTSLVAQNTSVGNKAVKIANDKVERIISLEDGRITTSVLQLTDFPVNFVRKEKPEECKLKNIGGIQIWKGPNPEEFSFLLDGKKVTGKTGWENMDVKPVSEGKGDGFCIYLKGSQEINKNIEIALTYLTYPGLPVIRKKIVVMNHGNTEISLDDIDTECLTISWQHGDNIVYQNYGRYKHIGPYVSDWDDPAVILHDRSLNRGIVMGNEAPGITKRTTSCLDGRSITMGLCHHDQVYPCRVWLSPGDKWESPWTFIALYNDNNPRTVIDGPVNDFVRKYMGIRLAQIPHRPTFVYNTWVPFYRNINDSLIRELADATSECGIQEFIIDDGWQVGFGDWEVDYKKFPNGLKPVFDYIKSKGMKPGLWISLGSASTSSKVYQEHPEWFVKDKNGETVDLHTGGTWSKTACLTTGWKDYIKGKILKLVREHGLEYVKLDFAIATSCYMFDREISGCYAKDHPHKDRTESYLEIYRAAWQLFDELHAEAPELFIDCTYETMGALEMIDYDMCKHAEGNWLSNFGEPDFDGSLRVRQMAWWRSPVIPATALVIGNMLLNDENSVYSFKSLTGALPIMLGDPRKLSPQRQKEFRGLANWLSSMEQKYQVMLFRQDLPDFGDPSYGQWDGFQRINTDTKSGGIIGVFKQNSGIKEKTITVKQLDPKQMYVVKEAVTGEIVAAMSGGELQTKGFKLTLNQAYEAALFEIALKK